MNLRILLVGGGTGGHIYPLIAIGRELQKLANEKGMSLELMAVADSNRWRSEFENQGMRFKKFFSPKLRRVEGGPINLLAFLALPIALIQALWILFFFMPNLVFSKGGFASLIPTLVAQFYFIPVFIHESDSIPGSANRFAAKFAKKIFISFENAAKYFSVPKTVLSGNPLREGLLNGNKTEATTYFNLNPDKKTVLFLAGSQGARFINDLVINSLVELTKEFHPVRSPIPGVSADASGRLTSNGVQIIHQTGVKNFESVKKEIENIKKEGMNSYGQNLEKNYRVYGFLNEEELKNAYAIADTVVTRSGSNIFEIAALGKPSIVIPYPYSARNHQKENAKEFAKFGAIVLEEENLKPHILIDQIGHLLNTPAVGERIKRFAKTDAAKIIAEEILNNF